MQPYITLRYVPRFGRAMVTLEKWYIAMLNKNALGVKKGRGQEEAAL